MPGRHDQGGWSQARYERHIDEIVERHWRQVADDARLAACGGCGARIVLVGAEEMRSEFESLLSNEVRRCLPAGRLPRRTPTRTKLLEAARPVLEEWWAAADEEMLDALARGGRRGTAAPRRAGSRRSRPHRTAASSCCSSQDGVDQPAYQCPQCGRAQVTNGSCPLDGTRMEARESGFDLARPPDARARRHRARDPRPARPRAGRRRGGVAAFLSCLATASLCSLGRSGSGAS